MSLKKVPTLDLARFDTDRENFVREVGEAYEIFGFCCFKNHGIAEHLIKDAYDQFKKFFALPDTVKKQYFLQGKGGARGYTPFKIETAKDQTLADLKEFWHIGPEHGGTLPNVWPEEVPEFKQKGSELYAMMGVTANKILTSMALHIGLPANYFEDKIDHGDTILRALHYPPVRAEDLPAVRAGAHEDIDLITLLVGATDSGLELLTKEGTWLPIEAQENTLIVNVGDMLQRLTNHQYRSTTHRVVNPEGSQTTKPRYSMPFFVHPNPEFVIDALPQCITEANPKRYPPITAQQYLEERLKEIKLSK